jgi:ubiquinone/menaquinone biosynthesis C-methylase UbiE
VLQPKFPDGVRLGDIIRGLPIPEGSCQGIYCSHVLEHLSLEDCRLALRNSHRYLAPGGRFRLVLPDLRFAVTTYLENPRADASIEFMEKSLLGWKSRPRGIKGLVHSWLTNARHLWMWDEKSLAAELSAAGFSSVRRASFGDSDDPHFEAVETPSRWENCLGFECIK